MKTKRFFKNPDFEDHIGFDLWVHLDRVAQNEWGEFGDMDDLIYEVAQLVNQFATEDFEKFYDMINKPKSKTKGV